MTATDLVAQAALLAALCADQDEIERVDAVLNGTVITFDTPAPQIVARVRAVVVEMRRQNGDPAEGPVTAAAAARCARMLDDYVVRWNDATEGLSLYHDPCGDLICDVEHGDVLGVLAATGLAHRCPTHPKENTDDD